jgi:hypothetical protein
MHGATLDSTFGFIAARAARVPVIVKNSQVRTIMRRSLRKPETGDPGIRWLIVNTLAMNRFLKETRSGASRQTGSPGKPL